VSDPPVARVDDDVADVPGLFIEQDAIDVVNLAVDRVPDGTGLVVEQKVLDMTDLAIPRVG
jgi:hypothetical protein